MKAKAIEPSPKPNAKTNPCQNMTRLNSTATDRPPRVGGGGIHAEHEDGAFAIELTRDSDSGKGISSLRRSRIRRIISAELHRGFGKQAVVCGVMRSVI
jgi:hypothetical protein